MKKISLILAIILVFLSLASCSVNKKVEETKKKTDESEDILFSGKVDYTDDTTNEIGETFITYAPINFKASNVNEYNEFINEYVTDQKFLRYEDISHLGELNSFYVTDNFSMPPVYTEDALLDAIYKLDNGRISVYLQVGEDMVDSFVEKAQQSWNILQTKDYLMYVGSSGENNMLYEFKRIDGYVFAFLFYYNENGYVEKLEWSVEEKNKMKSFVFVMELNDMENYDNSNEELNKYLHSDTIGLAAKTIFENYCDTLE